MAFLGDFENSPWRAATGRVWIVEATTWQSQRVSWMTSQEVVRIYMLGSPREIPPFISHLKGDIIG